MEETRICKREDLKYLDALAFVKLIVQIPRDYFNRPCGCPTRVYQLSSYDDMRKLTLTTRAFPKPTTSSCQKGCRIVTTKPLDFSLYDVSLKSVETKIFQENYHNGVYYIYYIQFDHKLLNSRNKRQLIRKLRNDPSNTFSTLPKELVNKIVMESCSVLTRDGLKNEILKVITDNGIQLVIMQQ